MDNHGIIADFFSYTNVSYFIKYHTITYYDKMLRHELLSDTIFD